MFNFEINTDHDAFQDDNAHQEIARILRDLADKVEQSEFGVHNAKLRDINGNVVGCVKW